MPPVRDTVPPVSKKSFFNILWKARAGEKGNHKIDESVSKL